MKAACDGVKATTFPFLLCISSTVTFLAGEDVPEYSVAPDSIFLAVPIIRRHHSAIIFSFSIVSISINQCHTGVSSLDTIFYPPFSDVRIQFFLMHVKCKFSLLGCHFLPHCQYHILTDLFVLRKGTTGSSFLGLLGHTIQIYRIPYKAIVLLILPTAHYESYCWHTYAVTVSVALSSQLCSMVLEGKRQRYAQ